MIVLTDETYQEFIKEGNKVLMFSLVLQNGKDCPYCIELEKTFESYDGEAGTITINDAPTAKRELFKNYTGGFPVTIVFENGVEKYRRVGKMDLAALKDFVANGTQPEVKKQKTIQEFSIVEIKALIYDEMVVQERSQANVRSLNDELNRRGR